nr:RNA-directed DNA polymerase, eukaryota, reverse transcriptase zinc-binding domain protein [Tanacetum cinerariifolium]
RVAPGDQSNGMRNMLFKLKFLKSKIREWINEFKNNSNTELIRLKGELQAVDGDIDNGNGSDEFEELKCDISKEELKRAVWDCGMGKSPGPDGFTFGVFRKFWSTMMFMRLSRINLSPSVNLSHMFYADDAVFIGHWNDSNINTFVNVLECFYRASGLRINMYKRKIMGVLVEGDLVKHTASKLGCLILNTPFVYLGTKVEGKMSRVKEWNEVVDKVVSRLSKWKMKTLSIGERLTLLKSVLGSILIFHMSIYRVPSRILQQLESIRNRFFNGNDLGSKKATWI